MKTELSQSCHLFFSTLGNPTRLAILEFLREGPSNVTQIIQSLGQEQSMVSHNLRPLVQCGFVFVERQGKERIYTLNSETMEPLFKIIDNHIQHYCPKGGSCRRRPHNK
ncbi:MAG: ArsR/SmtB family transcription factor [Candidatus Hodarchaeota archaeon]